MNNDGVRAELLKRISDVREHFSLAPLNTFGTGGLADFYTEAKDTGELAAAVRGAIDAAIPYVVIGAGESILFPDGGFPGLVIRNKAANCVIASDRSQMIVDSGMSLRRFIAQAAGQGFGGLIHLYPLGGTLGGAIYSNATAEGRSILSSVRYLTVLMPPTKMKVDVTVMRYKPDWLLREGGGRTRLRQLRADKPLEEPQPVILNAQLQLTSVRNDELVRRISLQARSLESSMPSGVFFGPVFEAVEGRSLDELLAAADLGKLRDEGLFFDRRHRNFLRRSNKIRPTAAAIDRMAEAAAAAVRQATGAELVPAFEKIGPW
jgi:UDP-N-acetylmuramate dehydrogenase